MTLLAMPTVGATAPVVTAGPRWSGAVALTFDDGISRQTCARVANTLRANGIKGTFFINAVNLVRKPNKWRRILKGMPVGNHTYSHPDLRTLSDQAIRHQLRKDERVTERILGRPMRALFRPPYGSTDSRVQHIAGQLGYRRTVLWTLDPRDWSSYSSTSEIVARSTGGRPGSIILMHCNRWETAQALPAIIASYRARGIRFVTLPHLFGS